MKRLALIFIAVLAVEVRCASKSVAPQLHFRSAECQVSFRLPAGWEVAPAPLDDDQPCSFDVRPKQDDRRSIAVFVSNRGFAAAIEDAPFIREGNRWLVLGRMAATSLARELRGSGWRGLLGRPVEICERGECRHPAALIGNDRRSAELIGAPDSEDEFDLVLRSFRFGA